jgi:hemerythrin-like domain-containing protein
MAKEQMSPEELAEWMHREHEALIELNKILRKHIALMPEVNLDDWLHGLKTGFDRLRTHLERNFAAKEAGGYLSIVIEQRPTLAAQVESIRREHGEILRMAERILRDMENLAPEYRLLVGDISARVQRFMAVVNQHDQRENMITLLVYNQDIGTDG